MSLDTAVVGSLLPSPEFLIILAVWGLVYSCPCFHDHQTYIEEQHGRFSICREQIPAVLSDKFTRNITVGAITAALSFRKHAEIPSNPVAFFTFKSLSCFRINFSEIGYRIERSLVRNFYEQRVNTG